MPGKAAKIELTVTMYETIQQICNSRRLSLSVVARAKAILLGFDKRLNEDIARQLSINRKTVGLWRRRWRDSFPALLALQFSESVAKFRRYIEEVLSDAPRSGAPGKFTPSQIVGIIAVACELPSQSGIPVTTWTGRELAGECEKRGLVESISASHVNYLSRCSRIVSSVQHAYRLRR
ncbi:MAG: helix-turn-helix domain-containing protein [Planctomycetes bacterium]|nr:helix-turn-helix domain-containing protein [Planctomycetota bacterium]